MQIAFRFAHAPERIAYPPDAYVTPSRLRRSQMPCDKYSRDGSYILDLPPFPQASLLHNLPASAMRAQTHPPAACASSASLTEHMPRVASPSPASLTRCASLRAITLRLRMRMIGVGAQRARNLSTSPPLAAQVMWTAFELKDRHYNASTRSVAGLCELPGLVFAQALADLARARGRPLDVDLSCIRYVSHSVGYLWWSDSQICSHLRRSGRSEELPGRGRRPGVNVCYKIVN